LTSESSYEQARFLAANLAAFWNGAADILSRLVKACGNGDVSPWEALKRLGPDGFEGFCLTEPQPRGPVACRSGTEAVPD
jgi:hypothetical protein